MKAPIGLLALALLTIGAAGAALNPNGVLCGDVRCTTVEYCSHHDKHCKPCSNICNVTGRNYEPVECSTDCQEYLHDQRYVLLEQYNDLRGEVGRLWILVAVSTTAAVFSLLSSMYLLAKMFPRWVKMRAALARLFTGKCTKVRRETSLSSGSKVSTPFFQRANNGNNRRSHNNNNNKVQEDAESGTVKHNGLKLTMPTISASVAPSREPERGTGNESGSASGTGSRSGSGSGPCHATPNTTTTSLSGRHPSEDTTLDYAYDNPAMTPSPETAQLRAKRESSF
nr:uncharacterized protein LOC117607321 isoform X1 [Osmia lignaria]XP_034186782.1 uncharacterized protein LOC117607321 isoform X1 [Osmia lignaria]